jgi:hypothetical protein
VLEDCFVMPSSSCLHDIHGRPIVGSALNRGPDDDPEFPYGKPQSIDPQSLVGVMESLPSAVFLPYSDLAPFGHRLTEGAAWLWPFLDPATNLLARIDPGTKVLIVDRPTSSQSAAPIVKLLDLPLERIQTTSSLQRPLLCHRVILPVPSMVNRRWLAPHHFLAVQRLLDRLDEGSSADRAEISRIASDSTSTDKVYLSRSRLGPGFRRLHGEARLEECLGRRGWQIVHPESLSIGEQLLILARARILAGEMGSSFHLLMGLGCEFARKTVVMLGVRGPCRDRRVANFTAQFRQQPVNFHYFPCLGFFSASRSARPHTGITVPFDRRFLVPKILVADRLEHLAAVMMR